MIEAVNSVIANASLLRGNTEQTDVTRSYAVNPESLQKAPSTPQAPYISPFIHVDTNYNKAVLLIRDSDTGDVVRQFPSESALEARQRDSLRRASGQDDTSSSQSVSSGSGESSGGVTPGSGSFRSDATGGSGVAEAQVAAQALQSSAQVGQANSTVSVTA